MMTIVKMSTRIVVVAACFVVARPVTAVEPHQDTFLGHPRIEPVLTWNDPDEGPAYRGALDTLCFGGHDGMGYAVQDGIWDFEDETLQGWTGPDNDPQGGPWWKRMGKFDYECPDGAPMIGGTPGQLWIGDQQTRADVECWVCDAGESCALGYVNGLSQRAESPDIPYSDGDVDLGFKYFTDNEGPPYDFTTVQVVALAGGEELEVFDLGALGGLLGDPDNPLNFIGTLSSSDIPMGTDEIRVRFDFSSDGGWSNEDGGGGTCSTYGPMGVDDVSVRIGGAPVAGYDFNEDDEGWTFESLNPDPVTLIGVNELSDYDLELPPDCGLDGFVLEFHDDDFNHPDWQYDIGISPIIDRSAAPYPGYDTILAFFDLYTGDEPYGFFWRPGWQYYPWVCEPSGVVSWSPRVGSDTWFLWCGGCYEVSDNATANGVPPDAEQYRFVIEILFEDCGISECTDPAPLIDNIQVCFVGPGASDAPEASGPAVNMLLTNRPNPFTPRTEIRFRIASAEHVDLAVYDAAGRLVKQLVNRRMQAGLHGTTWDGMDETGEEVAAGIYWSRLGVGDRVERRKMALIR